MRFVIIFHADLEVVEVAAEQVRLCGRFDGFDRNDWEEFASAETSESERISCTARYGDSFFEATIVLVSLDDTYDLSRAVQYCRQCRREKGFRPKSLYLQVTPRIILPGMAKRLRLKPVQSLQTDVATTDSEAEKASGRCSTAIAMNAVTRESSLSTIPKGTTAQLYPMLESPTRSPASAAADSNGRLPEQTSLRATLVSPLQRNDTSRRWNEKEHTPASLTSSARSFHQLSRPAPVSCGAAAADVSALINGNDNCSGGATRHDLERQGLQNLMEDLETQFGDLATLQGVSKMLVLLLREQQLQKQKYTRDQQQLQRQLAALGRQGGSISSAEPAAQWQPAASWPEYLRLASDEAAKKSLRIVLQSCRAESHSSTVRRMISKCLSDKMMAEVNYCGRGLAEKSNGLSSDERLGFKITLLPLVQQAVLDVYADTPAHLRPSERDVERMTIGALKHAGDNLRKKASVKRSSLPAEELRQTPNNKRRTLQTRTWIVDSSSEESGSEAH